LEARVNEKVTGIHVIWETKVSKLRQQEKDDEKCKDRTIKCKLIHTFYLQRSQN